MTTKELETKLFCEGLTIEAETITSDNQRVRLVSTLTGENYKFIYHRNEHYVFVIHDIIKL